jgi:hypothetical protein
MSKCKNPNCSKRAYYKYKGHKLIYCAMHKKERLNNNALFKIEALRKFIDLGYWPVKY